MTPTDHEIAAAFDLLDWLTDKEIQPMRAAVDRCLRLAQSRRERGEAQATEVEALRGVLGWTGKQVALLWVLWQTSDLYLTARGQA